MRPLCILALLGIILATSPARAADVAPQPLQTVRLLGGGSTLADIAFPDDIPRAQIIPSLIRYLHATREGEDAGLDEKRQRLLDTLTVLARADAAAAAWPSGLSLQGMTGTQKRRVEESLSAFGLELREQRNVYSVREDSGGDQRKARDVLTRAGIDVAAMVRRLNAGEAVRIDMPATELPMPLTRQVWQPLLEHGIADGEWLPAVLADRRASLLAYGLLGMDAITRGWLAANPGLLKEAFDHAPAFAAVASSIRFRQGQIDMPGGTRAVATWQALVDEKPAAPDKVFRSLVTKDDGALAVFFHAVSELDAARLQFVLGGPSPDRESMKTLYASFSDSKTHWTLNDWPFARGRIDGAVILRSLTVSPAGVPDGPRWRRFWDTVFGSDDVTTKKTGAIKSLTKNGMVTAPWFVEAVLSLDPKDRDLRLRTLLFAQRVFPSPRDVDTLDIVVALRGYQLFPSMGPTLERIGIRTPSVYAALTRAAAVVAQAPDDVRVASLAQFQGALALLDRLKSRGAISSSDAERAASDLAMLPVDGSGWFNAGVTKWLKTVTTRIAADGGESSVQSEVVAAALGTRNGRSTRPFAWESETYAISLASAETDRIMTALDVRMTLDAVLRLVDDMATISSAANPAAAQRAAMATQLPAKSGAGILGEDREADLLRDAQESLQRVGRITKPKDLKKIAGMLTPLQRLTDVETASWLRAFAYATFSSAEDVEATLDVARRHDFGVPAATAPERQRAWREPAQTSDQGGWRIHGSLLGLDMALSRFVLRRLSTELPPHPPTLDATMRDELARTVALMDPSAIAQQQLETIAAALKRGRERWLAAASTPDPAEALRAVKTLSPWRREAVAWTAAHDPEHLLAQATAHDLLELGSEPSSMPLDAWGTAQALSTGCLCLRLRTTVAWEDLAGRLGNADGAAAIPDVSLRLAEHLAALQVPAELLPAIAALATQDVIDAASAAGDEDSPMALARSAAALTRARVEDYVAAVIARSVAREGDTAGTKQ